MNLESLLDTLAKLDWFEQADALRRAGTPSVKFAVSRNAGWGGQQIEEMLKGYGVKIWQRGFTPDSLTFRAKRVQAQWCEYLLLRHGIPIVDGRAIKKETLAHTLETMVRL